MLTGSIMTESQDRCPECGFQLTGSAASGDCPRCLLELALAEDSAQTQPTGIMSSGSGYDEPRKDHDGLFDSDRQNPQTFFGDYEILEEIASGGMGTVFRARQASLNRIVALKVVRNGRLAGEVEIERFHKEAEAAANLDHPGIISVYEVGNENGQLFFSMPLLENGSLSQWVSQRHTPADRRGLCREDQFKCAAIIAAAAEAVHFAHQRQILHRDLKPDNILLHDDDRPCITDFGLARSFDADSRITASGTLVGTPAYMAPEQATGNSSQLTTATDVYGLGAVMYEMLTGRPPFQGSTAVETILQVTSREPTRPASIVSVDQDLETICLKCLEKDPADRFGSADALAADLNRWLKQEPIQSRKSGIVERVRKWSRRHPAVAFLSAALFFVTFTGFVAVLWQLRQTQNALELARETAIAEATARAVVLEPDQVLTHDGPVLDSVFSPDGARVLTASHDKLAALWDVRNGQKLSVLEGHTGVLCQAKFSTDGARILTVSHDGTSHFTYLDPAGTPVTTWSGGEPGDRTVKVWDAFSGELVTTLDGHSAPVTDACFSPDGRQVLTGSLDQTARIWDAASGKELVQLKGHNAAILAVAYSPDGRSVLTSSYGQSFDVQSFGEGSYSSSSSTASEPHLAVAWDARDGKKRFTLRNYGNSSRAKAVFSPNGRFIATAAADPRNCALWNAADGSLVSSLSGHIHEINNVSFSDDSSRVVTASSDATARIYNVPDGDLVATLRGHDLSVLRAQFSPNGRRVLTASADGNARVWEAATGKGLAVLKSHYERVCNAAFSPDGLRVTTASLDGTAAIWKSATMEQLAIEMKGHSGRINTVDFHPDGTAVVTSSQDGSAIVWDTKDGTVVSTLRGHAEISDDELRDRLLRDTRTASFDPTGTMVVTATEETSATVTPLLPGPARQLPFNPLRVFDAATGKEVVAPQGLPCGVQFATFSPDGKLVAGTPDASLRLFTKTRTGMRASSQSVALTSVYVIDVETRRIRHTLAGHLGKVEHCAFSPDSRFLATADEKGIRIFDLHSGNAVAELKEGFARQVRLQFSPDGSELLCYGYRDFATVLAATDLQLLHTLRGHEAVLTGASFSSDGQLVATTAADATARLWEAATGRQLHVLSGHRHNVYFAAFDPLGKHLATASEDRIVRLWDTATGAQLLELPGHRADVTCGTFSPDGRWLATGSDDFTARLWPVYVALDDAPVTEQK